MKRLALLLTVFLAIPSAFAQAPDLKSFQTGFTTFAEAVAPTLSYNATVGGAWSDAYIGGFPHLGAGIALGFTSVPLDDVKALLGTMQITNVPQALETLGLPIPAMAVAAKLGGFFLPFDVGLKGMIVPEGAKSTLAAATGLQVDYLLFGGNIRYALIEEGLLLPDLSIGAGYKRLSGSVRMPLGIDAQSFTFATPDSVSHTLAVTKPDLELGWTTDSFDFTVQASKSILFIEPYLGLGLSIGNSAVKGGVRSAMTYDGAPVTDAQVEQLKTDLAAAGIAMPDLSATGFLFGADSAAPVFRVYGGVSLSLFIIKLDLGATYVPQTGSLGGQVLTRIQF